MSLNRRLADGGGVEEARVCTEQSTDHRRQLGGAGCGVNSQLSPGAASQLQLSQQLPASSVTKAPR